MFASGRPFASLCGLSSAALAWIVCAILATALSTAPAHADKPGRGDVVIDVRSGDVLHAYNPDRRLYPASLTKVMTLYLTFEALERGRIRLDQPIEMSAAAASQPPSKLGLAPGSTLTFEEAILALVTKSANDVAAALAEALGGSEAKFGRLMTAKARRLGMRRTVFRNASGLPDPEQVSTPRDMAMLGLAMQRDFPQYYHYFSTDRFEFRGASYRNHNRLLGSYDGVDGIKTGYTVASGFNLISSAERDGVRLIAVVFGGRTSRSRDDHMRKLLDESFARATVMADRRPSPAAREGDMQLALASADADRLRDDGAGTDDPRPGAPWAVQVGAFRTYESARRRALEASRLVPGPIERLTVAISPTGSRSRPLFRVRLVGLADEAEARRTCDLMQRRKIGCLPLSPNSDT